VLGLTEEDRIFSTTKLYHAYGLGNALSFPLWFGATAVLVTGPPQAGVIAATLREQRPSVFCSVPALYAVLARAEETEGALASVRLCVSAAEPLPAVTYARWKERFGLEIVDGLGSTELLHIYCCNRPGACVAGTSGYPVPGYELRLLDEHGAVLEGPAVGELEVRGDSCAPCYWHQHAKTTHCMRGEWFASGDRYERRADGAYAYVGRVDDMLKVGGLWVSPIDMEHVLLEHPRVRGVGVIGVSVESATRIAAYVECDGEGGDALADELRMWCKERMHRYEYPHLVHFVDELPRTLTGKVQRFRLRELAESRPVA
jgi:benzoate-CoA ligase